MRRKCASKEEKGGSKTRWRAFDTATSRKAMALAVWLALMATGVVQVLFTVPFTPALKRLFELGPADQALRNVAQQAA